MSSMPLRIVPTELSAGSTGPSERRRAIRLPLSGHATAVIRTGGLTDSRMRICALQLLNVSDTGLGAVAEEPIEPGASITVLMPPHGPDQGLDLSGEVVRCARRAWGHEVGIHFHRRLAA